MVNALADHILSLNRVGSSCDALKIFWKEVHDLCFKHRTDPCLLDGITTIRSLKKRMQAEVEGLDEKAHINIIRYCPQILAQRLIQDALSSDPMLAVLLEAAEVGISVKICTIASRSVTNTLMYEIGDRLRAVGVDSQLKRGWPVVLKNKNRGRTPNNLTVENKEDTLIGVRPLFLFGSRSVFLSALASLGAGVEERVQFMEKLRELVDAPERQGQETPYDHQQRVLASALSTLNKLEEKYVDGRAFEEERKLYFKIQSETPTSNLSCGIK